MATVASTVAHGNLPDSFPHQLSFSLICHDKLYGSFISWYVLGIKKKLNALFTKSVKTRWGLKWIPSIVNHLYKSVCTTPRNSQLRKEMWSSVVNHLCNQHTHPGNLEYKTCQHEDLPDIVEDEEGNRFRRAWLDKSKFVLCLLV